MFNQDVDARVNAYRGNPEALQQKYAVSQELVDLLALQKIKSEMDSKSRQMQLSMAQQGKKPTIAQQLQQEVVGRTKQEMQQQLAGTMQQEQAIQTQEQGVAGLPTPNMMPTRAMAAGGILDFSAGGSGESNFSAGGQNYRYEENEDGMAAGGIVAFAGGGNKELEDNEAAKRKRVVDRLFPAVVQAESRGDPNAVSRKGAQGAAQVMPKTLRNPGFGVTPARDNSHAENVRVGKEYLDAMLRKYKDVDTALAAYNWGPSNVDKWLASGADPRKLPAETRAYIPLVKTFVAGKEQGIGEKVAEGITSLFPSAEARDPDYIRDPSQERGIISPRSQAPSAERAVPSVIAGPTQPTPPKSIVSPSAPLLPPESRPYPETGGSDEQRKSMPYPTGRIGPETNPTAGQPVTDDVVRQMAQPPAPPLPQGGPVPTRGVAPAPSGLDELASQQQKMLGKQLSIDPAELRRSRGQEYYQSVGVPIEQAAAEKAKRLAGLEALDAGRAERERRNEITEALLGARGSSWQGALGSAGSAGLAAERRNADIQRQRLVEANTAKDALADISLGVKKSVYDTGIGALKEGETSREKAATEAGLAVGRGMTAETARMTNEANIKSNEMIRDAQMELAKVQDEGLRQVRVESARAATIRSLAPLHNRYKAYSDQIALGVKLEPEQLKDMQALEKQLKLETNKINDRFDNMISGGNTNEYVVRKIK